MGVKVMRSAMRAILMAIGVLGAAPAIGPSPVQGQMAMSGAGRSLGGYGASTISSYYGGSGGGYLPYTGGGSGFVPYRGGPGGGMGVVPIPRQVPTTPIGGVMMGGTPIGGASLSGAMGMDSRGGMGMGSRSRPRALVPFGYEGGLGGGMSGMSATPPGGMRRVPSGPGFGYPFRMPPSLTGGSLMTMP
jgi:hypothetical protein